MNQADDTEQKLARLFDRALHELPPRHAPLTLESRVFGELARRAALPWWRRNFACWSRSARTLFAAGGAWIVAGAGSVRAWHQASAGVAASAALSGSMVRANPTAWLYEGAGLAAVLYALLFALGPAAYRTLWADLRELP